MELFPSAPLPYPLSDLACSDGTVQKEYIIPDALDLRVAPAVAAAVAEAARRSGVARL